MMLPSAAPTILLFARAARTGPSARRPVARTYAFLSGYVAVWTGFSLAATGLQSLLAQWAFVSPMMEITNRRLGAGVLMLAGPNQWTPVKRVCLTHCRGPLQWLTRHWRSGLVGAWRMGMEHGVFCLGCCWAVMLLLFVGGVMNLRWIAAITAFVLLEKLAPQGPRVARVAAAIMIAAGAWLLRPGA
jgi:predicted metal-binding membrane protein